MCCLNTSLEGANRHFKQHVAHKQPRTESIKGNDPLTSKRQYGEGNPCPAAAVINCLELSGPFLTHLQILRLSETTDGSLHGPVINCISSATVSARRQRGLRHPIGASVLPVPAPYSPALATALHLPCCHPAVGLNYLTASKQPKLPL